jgi:O-antigen/teichoic acid export membrane protein
LVRIKTLLQSSSLRLNFVGNVTGRFWLGTALLVAVPIYVHLLGADAFGIVSLVNALQAVLAVLDFGLAGTVNREVATLRGSANRAYIADVVRTFESIYWIVAIAVGLGVAGMSSWIAHSWVTEQSMPPGEIRTAIILGGIALAARWPVALYTGILQGLERQVLQNGIMIVAGTTRIGLTIAALYFISPTVYCFLITQAIVNIVEAIVTGFIAGRLATAGIKGRFDMAVVRRVWRFAASFSLVGALGSLASGADKLLISKLLPLVELTYYSIATTATGSLQVIFLAAQTSLFPRMAACWEQQDLAEMRRLYLMGLRFTVYICVGPTIVLSFFPVEVLTIWTRSPELAQHFQPMLPILAVAFLANCAQTASLTVLLAAGRTRIPMLVNAVSLPLMVIACFFTIPAFGTPGAAASLLAMNLMCFIIYGRCCFAKIFPDETQPFFWGLPVGFLVIGGLVGFLAKAVMPSNAGTMFQIFWLFLTIVSTYAGNIVVLNNEEHLLLARTLKKIGVSLQSLPRKWKGKAL